MKTRKTVFVILGVVMCCLVSCADGVSDKNPTKTEMQLTVYETSAAGRQLEALSLDSMPQEVTTTKIVLRPEQQFQTITGIGGSFTEATAYLLNQLSPEKRAQVLEAYFGDSGAKYSLTRTHIASCDFSRQNYTYAAVPGDKTLEHFTIEPDRADLIPIIKAAQEVSSDGFEIIASPWTAPPWMKDNNDWRGGKLLPEYYATWALYFSKYLAAYQEEGIDIWGITVENEPLGNANNWESMHFTAEEMNELVAQHLGPKLAVDGHDVQLLGYDQNRGEELKHWVDVMYGDEAAAQYYDGTAVHWYASTYDHFPASLQYAHAKAPNKYLIETEGCIDAEVPVWQDDAWYWRKEATDWGWDWATPEDKHLHPKYAPVYRYARDMIGCFNNWVDGWVDWNMVLDKQGGPNWFGNWCIAPVIVDSATNEVYFTPLYHTMTHFSRFIRPGDKRIGFNNNNEQLLVTATQSPTDEMTVVILNQTEEEQSFTLQLEDTQSQTITISPQALQTIIVKR